MPRALEAVAPARQGRAARPPAAGPDPLGELGELHDYAAKRTFATTPEPAPSAAPAGGGPLLFVIQQHSARRLHFDFRLECDGVLKSWAVPKGPSLDPAEKRLAVETEDHPYDYASFEGVIPPGQYGAGEVIVWDCGVYSPDEDQVYSFNDRDEAQRRVREGLAKGKLGFQLRGEKLKGSFALVRTTAEPRSWLLIKHKDRFAGPAAGLGDITGKNRSVLCGLAVEEVKVLPAHRMPATALVPSVAPGGKPAAMPATLSPMLAETGEAPFTDADWLWEPKLDGYRVLAFVAGDDIKLLSRRGFDLTATFPRLCAELRTQAADLILDGEVVAFDASGRPSFNALQNRFHLKTERDIAAADRTMPVVFCCFDLLHFAGVDLRATPYRDRRRYLAQCLLPSPLLQLVHAAAEGEALYAAALASGFEGVVGKRKDSRYEAGRRSAGWLKVKATQSGEFLVGGYTKGKGSRAALGALLIGYWDADAAGQRGLRYASHVGSGFSDEMLAQMRARLDGLRIEGCPFIEKPELNGPTTWVAPELVVEVKYQQWTEDGSLRAPVLLRVRDDIDPQAVRRPMPSAKRGHLAPAGVAAGSHREVGETRDPLNRSVTPANAGVESSETRDSGVRRNDEGGLVQHFLSEVGDILRQLENRKTAFPLAVGPHRIRLTHLDRVYWPADPALKQPAVTKRDLLRYFAQVSPLMLPHLADRPLTLIRMPDGIFGQRFFQKHWAQERPDFVDTMTVFSEHKDESHQALLCNNLATLLWLAQSGTLELHVWHSRACPGPDAAAQGTDYDSSLASLEASVLNFPDYVVFDLDPYIYSGSEAPGAEPELNTVAFEKGKEVAFHLRELLQSMALESIVKTSGKTGLHVFVPIRRTIDFDAARKICELVGRHLLRQHPKDITMEWSVRARTGKIFLDHNMNVRGKTLNVAYSPRGVPGAPVSMPLTWDELASAHPLDFRITNAAQRLAQTGDRWCDARQRKLSLEGALAGAKDSLNKPVTPATERQPGLRSGAGVQVRKNTGFRRSPE